MGEDASERGSVGEFHEKEIMVKGPEEEQELSLIPLCLASLY